MSFRVTPNRRYVDRFPAEILDRLDQIWERLAYFNEDQTGLLGPTGEPVELGASLNDLATAETGDFVALGVESDGAGSSDGILRDSAGEALIELKMVVANRTGDLSDLIADAGVDGQISVAQDKGTLVLHNGVEGEAVALPYLETTPSGGTVLVGPNGEAAINDAGLFGASPDASAAVNTAALQALLDVGGAVGVSVPGAYLVNQLHIGSDTTLRLAEGVELVANGAIGNIINTKVMSATKSSVTISWTSGTLATINWTVHGLAIGDYVWITGADQYQYLGVFPVTSVTDENTVVVKLRRSPAVTATGTILAIKAQRNVSIIGGIWNYNYSGGNTGDGYERHAIRLGGCHNLVLSGIKGKDTYKYFAEIAAVAGALVENGGGVGHLASDFLKVRGPAFNVCVRNIEASCGDDIVSVQTKEPAAYDTYNWSWGDCLGIKISNIGGYSATGAVIIYPNADGLIDGVVIDSVTHANATLQFRIDNNGHSGTAKVDNVTISNYSGSYHTMVSLATATGSLEVGSLNIDGCSYRQGTGNNGRVVLVGTGSIKANINVHGGFYGGLDSVINNSSTAAIRLNLFGVTFGQSYWNFFQIGGATNTRITMRGCDMRVNPGNAFLNISAGASGSVTIDADQINNPAGTQTVTNAGTTTVYTAGPGLKCDHAVIAPVAGSITYNTNAGYGTGAGLYATGAGSPVKLA